MTDIKSGAVYAPLYQFEEGVSELQGVFCFDQQKRNALHLLGEFTLEEIDGLPVAESINQYMDKETREHLRRRPLDFMQYWLPLDDGSSGLLSGAEPGYMTTMKRRAAETQAKMIGRVDEENVVRVNFRAVA